MGVGCRHHGSRGRGGAVGGDDVRAQAREALRRVVVVLEQVGAGPEHLVRIRMSVTDISRWEEVGRAHGEVFGNVRPSTSMREGRRLIDTALFVEIEGDGSSRRGSRTGTLRRKFG